MWYPPGPGTLHFLGLRTRKFLREASPLGPLTWLCLFKHTPHQRRLWDTTGSWAALGSSSVPIPSSLILALQLFDLIYREETLFNVIKSVTRNGRSILLTALLALILVYLFSIVGFLFLKDDFILEVDRLPSNHSRGLGPLSWVVWDERASVSCPGFWGGLAHTILPPSWGSPSEWESLGFPAP